MGAWRAAVIVAGAALVVAGFSRPVVGFSRPLPDRLSDTGLFAPGTLDVDPRNRPFAPQYPLWSDGAAKRRWIRLPDGATIDVRDIDRWDFPAGTRFWKEFAFGGRRVETRFLRREGDGSWTFGSYVWAEDQADARLAPEEGLPHAAEIAPGRWHAIPAVADCRACHDPAPPVGNAPPRTDILGFTALQLSTDRDPGALHAEALEPGMVTLQSLVEENWLAPARRDLLASPPRVAAPDEQARAVLGYLSTNCGSCHNEDSSIANLGLWLKARVARPAGADASDPPGGVVRLFGPTAKWQIPGVAEADSRYVTPGAPDLSALLVRMKSRRPSSQMPPLGTVLHDREAIARVEAWIAGLAPTDSR